MGFSDYFGNDDDEFEYEEVETEVKVTLDNKTFNSIDDMRENATDEELEKLLKIYDKKIIKSERAYKLIEIGNVVCKGLAALGFIGVSISVFAPSKLKDLLAVIGSAAVAGGLIGKHLLNQKLEKIENQLEEYYDVYDEIDDEILCREEGPCESVDYSLDEECREIFPDIFGEAQA